MNSMKTSTFRTSVAVMSAVISLLVFFAASAVPRYLNIPLLAFAGLIAFIPVCEQEFKKAILLFVFCSVAGLIFFGGFTIMSPYILFFGWYGIFKAFAESVPDPIYRWGIKLMLFNAAIAAMAAFAWGLEPVMRFPFYITLPIANVIYVVYDFLLALFGEIYGLYIRKWLIKAP